MNEDRILSMFFEKARWQYAIEQAFYLYIRAKNWSDKDEFELYSDGDYYDLVEEAKNMEL